MGTDKKRLSLLDSICILLSSLFGVGYTPVCPGTASCLVAVIFFILIKNRFYFFIFTLGATVLAFMICGRAEKIYANKDDKRIVIDDFCGMLISYCFCPFNIKFVVIGFFLFRMLDMLKIPPADKIEGFRGSLGIVGDDIIASLYCGFLLYLVNILASFVK